MPLPLALRFARLPQTLAYYLRATVLPVHLTILEPDPAFALLPTLLCTILLATLLLLSFRSRRTTPAVTLGILWFFLFLLPFSGLVPIPNAPVVDRFAYFPSLGLSIALLPLFGYGASIAPVRRTAVTVAISAVAVLVFLTLSLLPSWRASDALYARVRRFSPDNRFLAMHDFRHAVDDTGDYATARGIALRAPDLVDALPHYISQLMVYERTDALEFFRRFLSAYPDRPDYLANVAWFLSTSDWSPAPPSEALGYAARALALAGERPPPELLDTYAAALANASDFPAAVAAQERAISLLPPDAPSRSAYLARLELYRNSAPYREDLGIE